jgi:hypothetical protein
VLGLKWGRYGWANGSQSYTYTNALAAPAASPGYGTASNANCTGSTPDSELVRCTAQAALSGVGSGTAPGNGTGYGTRQAVDIRPAASVAATGTVATGGPNYNVPMDTVFNTGLTDIDPGGAQKIVVNRTQHTAGMVAVGLKMLGYNATFSKWGLAKYNNTLAEKYTGGANYPLVSAVIDTTAPTITSGPTATVTGDTSADIARTTDEPATTRVEYGTTSGGPYTSTQNDTVLHASNTASLTGLTPGTTYYAVVTVCDGQANCTTSSEVSFTTYTCGKPSLSMAMTSVYWASLADYTAHLLSIDYTVTNNGAGGASNVTISGSSASNGVTVASGIPAAIGTLGGGGGAGGATVVYNIPTGVGGFVVNNTGSADDDCGSSYTYP